MPPKGCVVYFRKSGQVLVQLACLGMGKLFAPVMFILPTLHYGFVYKYEIQSIFYSESKESHSYRSPGMPTVFPTLQQSYITAINSLWGSLYDYYSTAEVLLIFLFENLFI